jgi:membrane protease YdiL (CAAX protease family)
MNEQLVSTLLKVAAPAAAIALVLIVAKLRGFSYTNDLRLVWPPPRVLFYWLAIWALWMAAGELAINYLGMEQPKPWPAYRGAIIALRILAIGFLGPIAEELVMRGIVFFRISRTRVGPWGAIVICAVVWAAMHVQYDWRTITMIFFDGLLLGLARYRSRSTYVPMLMHVAANLFSIVQSLR